ncbi:uncharacterized protein RHOBADRAFT_52914, partial [Rhodotorula graminis WP1]
EGHHLPRRRRRPLAPPRRSGPRPRLGRPLAPVQPRPARARRRPGHRPRAERPGPQGRLCRPQREPRRPGRLVVRRPRAPQPVQARLQRQGHLLRARLGSVRHLQRRGRLYGRHEPGPVWGPRRRLVVVLPDHHHLVRWQDGQRPGPRRVPRLPLRRPRHVARPLPPLCRRVGRRHLHELVGWRRRRRQQQQRRPEEEGGGGSGFVLVGSSSIRRLPPHGPRPRPRAPPHGPRRRPSAQRVARVVQFVRRCRRRFVRERPERGGSGGSGLARIGPVGGVGRVGCGCCPVVGRCAVGRRCVGCFGRERRLCRRRVGFGHPERDHVVVREPRVGLGLGLGVQLGRRRRARQRRGAGHPCRRRRRQPRQHRAARHCHGQRRRRQGRQRRVIVPHLSATLFRRKRPLS